MRINLNRALHGWCYIAQGIGIRPGQSDLWLVRENGDGRPDDVHRLTSLTWSASGKWRARAIGHHGEPLRGAGENINIAIERLSL